MNYHSVESTLEKYGEKIAEYIDADDFDDYIILLLEANEVFKKEKLKKEKRLLMSFFVRLMSGAGLVPAYTYLKNLIANEKNN